VGIIKAILLLGNPVWMRKNELEMSRMNDGEIIVFSKELKKSAALEREWREQRISLNLSAPFVASH
jgi:hypothetical protein